MKRPSFVEDVAPPWSSAQAVGVVLGSHASLILGGSLVIVASGYSASGSVSDIPIGWQAAATSPLWIAAVVLTWFLMRRTHADPVAELGLRFRPVDLVIGVGGGMFIQWVVLPLLYWPIFRLTDTGADELGEAARELADTASGSRWGALVFLVMTVLCAPIAEETIYRGVLLRGLHSFGTWGAIVLSAVAFGALHLQGLQLPGLIAVGLICAIATKLTGRLSTAILVHATFNAITAIPLVFG